MQRETKECSLSEGQVNPYVKIVAALDHSLREGTATAFTKPRRTQLKADREKRLSGGTRKVIVENLQACYRLRTARGPLR